MGSSNTSKEAWASGDSYEPYVGRWSRLVAREFLHWLSISEGCLWLDVGCGTGALSQSILELANPGTVKGIDRSEAFVEFARMKTADPRAEFAVGNAQSLPVEAAAYDAAVSALVLNFVPEPHLMIGEMARVVHDGGTVALYVWDYAGRMQMMRHFWNAAAALDPTARDLDEGRRFPVCDPRSLHDLFWNGGLSDVQVHPIDIWAEFRDFDDYWSPFLGGQGPAPGYVLSLDGPRRARLRERVYNSLPFALDGSIPLMLRAWAVRGIKR